MHSTRPLSILCATALAMAAACSSGARATSTDEGAAEAAERARAQAPADEDSEATPGAGEDIGGPCPGPYTPVDLEQCAAEAPAGYGLSDEQPAEWGFGAGTRTLWFGRLMCQGGAMPHVHRAGNAGRAPVDSDSPPSETGTGTLDVLDKWEITCPGQARPTVVYHNMYRCGSPCPPKGLTLLGGEAFRAYVASQRAVEAKEPARALELARRAHELAPDFELTIIWRAMQEAEAGHTARALKLYERADPYNPEDHFVPLQKAELLVAASRFDEALPLLDGLLERLPREDKNHARALCLKAGALFSTDTERARELSAEACEAGETMCC